MLIRFKIPFKIPDAGSAPNCMGRNQRYKTGSIRGMNAKIAALTVLGSIC
jgi:hypothetical protein